MRKPVQQSSRPGLGLPQHADAALANVLEQEQKTLATEAQMLRVMGMEPNMITHMRDVQSTASGQPRGLYGGSETGRSILERSSRNVKRRLSR